MAIDIIAVRTEGFGQPRARMLQGEMDKSASTARPAADHVEDLLDSALEQTFPASDPVAVTATTAMSGVSIYIGLNNRRFRVMLE